MTKEEAFKIFSEWYESCLKSGLEPEGIVAQMDGMALITDSCLVGKLESDGLIRAY